MISATRRWLRRNRTNFAVGLGVLGVGYVAGQYVLSKILETRERMSSDRIARENLRRRFQQNQEDCTITVLALLPTATENILDALPVEDITHELQQQKAAKLGRSVANSEIAPSERSSGSPSLNGEDGKSLSSFQTESFLHTSQMASSTSGGGDNVSRSSRKTKAQLWMELKISSITRTFTLIYTLALLTILTRIQLNLLGRRSYLSSVVSLASHPPNDSTISLENNDDDRVEQSYGNDFETNRKYLTFSWWLLHRGWRDIMETVETAVKEAFGPRDPREEISLEKLSTLVVEIRKKVEGHTPEERRTHKWLPFLLPPPDQEEYVLNESGMLPTQSPTSPPPPSSPSPPTTSTPLRRLLDETSDLIDSPTFTHILTLLLDTLFSRLTDHQLSLEAYKLPPPDDPTSRITELPSPGSATAKLATIMAVVTRQAHAIGNGVPNEYVQALEGVRELEAFAAVVYSSNFAFEGGVAAEVGKEEERVVGEGEGGGLMEGGRVRMVDEEGEEGGRKGGVVESAWGLWEGLWGRVAPAEG